MEGKRRIGQEGRDHRRSWNPMEGRRDSVRTLGKLMETHRTLRKDKGTEPWKPMESCGTPGKEPNNSEQRKERGRQKKMEGDRKNQIEYNRRPWKAMEHPAQPSLFSINTSSP